MAYVYIAVFCAFRVVDAPSLVHWTPWTSPRKNCMAENFTVKEVAELLKKHRKTIYRYLDEQRFFPHAYKLKDTWLIPKRDVLKLSHRNSPSS
jgi:excisionase family DNA binding protein